MMFGLFSGYITDINFFVFHNEDGMTVHQTYTSDTSVALQEAGITLSSSDFVVLPDAVVRGVTDVYIEKRVTVYVTVDGAEKRVTISGGTVSSALFQAGYEPQPKDIINYPLENQLIEGMEITVTRSRIETVQVAEEIPYDVIMQDNPNLNKGTEVVTQEGAPGKRIYTYDIVYKDGIESERRLVLSAVVTEPIPQITQCGSGNVLKTADGSELSYDRRLECAATAYTTEGYKNKTNAIGNVARVGTIAVDPKVIPLRSKVYVTSTNGKWTYGFAVAEDTGGVIKGNIVDLFFDTRAECISFGRRKCWVYVLSK